MGECRGRAARCSSCATRRPAGELYEAAAEVLGADGADLDREWVLDRLSSLSYTIAAGTSQIQRNIVAERILGLPKGR